MIMTLIAMFGLGYYGASKQGYTKNQVFYNYFIFIILIEINCN